MDKLVSDVGLALYAYLDNSDEKPTPETFHRFLNDGQVIDFLSNHFESKDVTDHREHLGPDAEKKEWSNTGISALQLFVSYNWLGVSSPVTDRLETLLKNAFPNTDKYLELTEENYQKIKSKELLCLAKYCLLSSVDQEEKTTATLIWELRYLSVHQVVLGEPSLNLYKRVKRNVASLNHYIEVPSELRERLLRTQLSAEVSQILLWYKEVGSSRLYLENALSFSGLNIELSGALGVRTKYQEKPTSQLVIQVDRKNDEKFMVENSKRTLIDNPKNAVLDDDTLLNNVKFVNPKGDEQDTMLFPEEEAVVLAVATHKKRAGAFGDELVQDELATFVEYLLSKSSVWAIRFKALLLRSLMEQTRRRKVERAMMQLDHLVCAVRGDEIVEGQNRLDMFYAALPDPSWVIEKHLGDILISMGCFKTALDVFERIQSWKDMITCYHKLDRKHHAEKIIRDQLAKEESPYLWYLLGNATDDVSFYEKSWTESGEKYYKAQTALADYYFDRKEYATCISHYQTSLKLNSLQINSWQRLGYACLHGEDYEGSARAYRRYLEFEQDAYEAWNNLSKAYIKLNNKERAYRTLMEAIKWNYEEWRLWENFLLVAVDIGSFEEAMTAWHRLIELKAKHEDDDVIEILVNSVINNVNDFNGNGSGRLAKKLLALLARISNTNYSSARLWLAYARLLEHQQDDADRVADFIRKSNRCVSQKPNWSKTPELALEVLEHFRLSIKLFTSCQGRMVGDQQDKALTIFRLSFNNIVRSVEASLASWDKTKNNVEQVNQSLNCLVNEMKNVF